MSCQHLDLSLSYMHWTCKHFKYRSTDKVVFIAKRKFALTREVIHVYKFSIIAIVSLELADLISSKSSVTLYDDFFIKY